MSGKFHKERYINVHNIPSDTPSNTKKLRASCTKLKAQSNKNSFIAASENDDGCSTDE